MEAGREFHAGTTLIKKEDLYPRVFTYGLKRGFELLQ